MPETIVAPATPPGEGGVAIVRLSGPQSIPIADTLYHGKRPLAEVESHRLAYGTLGLPGASISDEVLVAVMRAPNSYTREDVVEINCHGGSQLAEEVVRACCDLGARRAERGEFTERAFLNGRLDLAQAEAVLDIVGARTRTGISAACYQLAGGLSERLRAVSALLTSVVATIEASLEFEEDDLGLGDSAEHLPRIRSARDDVAAIARTYDRGRLALRGASVAIVGPPNVGKSSLLNAILGEDRAIVAPTPGTTRDLIEAEADLDGIRVRFLDTAGIRHSGDSVEREGSRRAGLAAESADLVLLVCDASGVVPPEACFAIATATAPCVVVANKVDIGDPGAVDQLRSGAGERPFCETSALKHLGIDDLCAIVRTSLMGDSPDPPTNGIVLRERHYRALTACGEHLGRAIGEAGGQARTELVAADLRLALNETGLITGETTPEDVLRAIFSEFCVGK